MPAALVTWRYLCVVDKILPKTKKAACAGRGSPRLGNVTVKYAVR
jgi:hypothetical protein